MRRALRSRSIKKVKRRTPGGRLKIKFKSERKSHQKCGNCGAKLNVPREVRKLSRTERRPERPYANFCSGCMREALKSNLRGI